MKKVFTLIELLIVIAIIAILLSLLLPSLINAKKASYGAVCGSNMKQIGLAIATYTKNNRNKLPQSVDGSNTITWDDLLSDYDGRSLTDSEKAQTTFDVSDSERHRLYRCPGSKWDDSETPDALRSYSVNGGFTLFDGKGLMWHYGSVYNSQIQDPGTTLMLVERDQIVWNKIGGASSATTWAHEHYLWHDTINRSVHGNHHVQMMRADHSLFMTNPDHTLTTPNMWTRVGND